jgi:hypothetical protein
MGGLATVAGLVAGIASLVLGLNGWEVGRLWLYLLGSAMSILLGVQLIIYWILLRVLDELSRRDVVIERELEIKSSLPASDVTRTLPTEAVHV